MGKGRSKNKVKRSTATLPKGIPNKNRGGGGGSTNAFEYAKSINSSTRVKHHVHNRIIPGQQRPSSTSNNNNSKQYQSSLSKSISLRKSHLSAQIQRQSKSNKFIDRRIGEATNRNNYDGPTNNDIMLKRIVQERVRRSNKRAKYSLQDDDDDDDNDNEDDNEGQLLTHGGKAIDYTSKTIDDVLLSDDSDDDLDKVDTMLHFGGGKFDIDNHQERSPYGPSSSSASGGGVDMGDVYRSRKEQLEERIRHKKQLKLEKLKRKENQVDTFDNMDKSFDELAQLLSFRDKESERKERFERKKEGKLSEVEVEMDDWDKEMKEYLFERKVRATDRTKTPEEIAQEESKRLHALESKRLARMDGDILSDDELSDISDDEQDGKKQRRRGRSKDVEKVVQKKKRQGTNPEEMSDSDDDDDDKKGKEEHGVQFTADGLMYVDKHGNFVGKVGEEEENDSKSEDDDSDSESDSSNDDKSDHHDLGGSDDEASAAYDSEEDVSEDSPTVELKKGMPIQGNYHASEQYGNKVTWYNGTITAIREENGTKVYDVTYDDGDLEEGMTAESVRPMPKSKEDKRKEQMKKNEVDVAKKKKLKAKMRAKEAIPFVFEVPTTLDGLHDLIAQYASTGADASLIIQRIHATNSVRLNHKNKEKMQNYYDVLLKRFVAVGDAIFTSGNGGPDLERYEQLNSLTQTLYAMSQDSPESAGAVWNRRLGIFQKALSKRLRDVEVTPLGDACEDEFTAWPSTGMLLLMRALPHIFPSTDRRHAVVTPALLLLGQILAQTPIKSRYDLVMGLFTTGLMLEYTKGAKRLAPEATAFLAGALRLFSDDVEATVGDGPLPSLANISKCPQILQLRQDINKSATGSDTDKVRLSLEKDEIQSDENPLAILTSTLKLTQQAFTIIGKSKEGSEREIFSEVLKSLLHITGKRKDCPLPSSAKSILADTARTAASTCASDDLRQPLQRRKSASIKDLAIKTLAPRMEDPTKYSMSKDKGKSQLQAEHDRHRREYKREHKAAMRELRLDSAFIESERRKAKTKIDDKAREKRHKNFAWLEAEQGLLNQQVRMGGGLLQGGGTGAARRAAKSGKLGIKKVLRRRRVVD